MSATDKIIAVRCFLWIWRTLDLKAERGELVFPCIHRSQEPVARFSRTYDGYIFEEKTGMSFSIFFDSRA